MTHSAPMADSEGDFGEFKQTDITCKCGAQRVFVRVWESSCGGYEDYNYRCDACGATWWIDGIDS